ncbi:MAG: GH116 family glycosyl hydrolase [Victivallaceae bacterium]|nr:GH116 family glycosyl hydrolase [Victivallaceae bacterium]
MIKNGFCRFNCSGEQLNHAAFPLGGIGAGMLCLEGTGAISHVSFRHTPEMFNEPLMFSALTIKNQDGRNLSLVLEGPVQKRKIFGSPNCGQGSSGTTYGLPRFEKCGFSWAFPLAKVLLSSEDCPLKVEISGWSPFIPGDSDNSSLPVAGLEFSFENPTDKIIEAAYSYNSRNFLAIPQGQQQVEKSREGFILTETGGSEEPWKESYFEVSCNDPAALVNPNWFRGGWFDPLTMAWKDISSGACPCRPKITEGDASPGASLYVPFELKPGEKKTLALRLTWYSPCSNLRLGAELEADVANLRSGKKESENKSPSTYLPWYSTRFKSITEISDYWRNNYAELKEKTLQFCKSLHAVTLPEKLTEAVAANLSILKSPTILRQHDGRLWGWEGCRDTCGSCAGSCTHVWNYAQALPHLFPDLERSLRRTEFNENQAENGHQNFRASLPIRPVNHAGPAAADGQLGGIMKFYREWRICGDGKWLKSLWPKVKTSLDYCIETWDPDHLGVLIEPHHNTYDIEFWGPDGMCSSFYLGALKAAALMAEVVNESPDFYLKLYQEGRSYLETELFNGEYFVQKIQWKNLRAGSPVAVREYSDEAQALLEKEGPKYQYGDGCLSDGVLGVWLAEVCGIGGILDPKKVKSHLLAVYKYNFKPDLGRHVNPQRPGYAVGHEGGLLLCTWPHGGKLSLPFVYSNEVWTGIEYQVASHLMMSGCVSEGMEIVEAVRSRYNGSVRNPFNEYECGHWYARAMSSYGLLQGITGIRYDAVEKVLYMAPKITGDFVSFLGTATGYGLAGIKAGEPFLNVIDGQIILKKIICK